MNPTADDQSYTDVLIIGAGPSGLMMASQLAKHGTDFRIIEKNNRQTSYSGAMFVQARSLEIFHELGIAEKAMKNGMIVQNIIIYYNGKKLIKTPVGDIGKGLSKFPFIFMLEQKYTEALLLNFLKKHDVEVERGKKLVHFNQVGNYLVAKIITTNGRTNQVRCKYLIGADGIHSAVRSLAEIGWNGIVNDIPLFVTDCQLNAFNGLQQDSTLSKAGNDVAFAISNKSIAGFFPLHDNQWRIDSVVPQHRHAKANLDFQDLKRGFSQRINLNLKPDDPKWFSVFKSNTYLADDFLKGQCFLIGDAAHVHTPIGAQGMNTGMQDAHNLAWKISFALKNKLPERLLKSYEQERRPVAKNLIHSTDRYFNWAIHNDIKTRFIRLYLFPFLIKLFSPALSWKIIRKSFFKGISEIGITYKTSLLIKSDPIKKSKPLKAGVRLPFVQWKGENGDVNELHQFISPDCFVLLFFLKKGEIDADIGLLQEKYKNVLKLGVIRWSETISDVFKKLKIAKNTYCLVRPDGYIAYVSHTLNLHWIYPEK